MSVIEAKRSATTVVILGPFVSTADVEQTALSLVSSSIKVYKGGTTGTNLPFAGSAPNLGRAHYKVTLQPAQTGGDLGSTVRVYSHPSGALAVWETIQIVHPDYYNAKYGTTRAEPAQGIPPTSTAVFKKLDYLYTDMRNKKDQSATVQQVYDDAGTTVLYKRTISDDGTTATKGKTETGA